MKRITLNINSLSAAIGILFGLAFGRTPALAARNVAPTAVNDSFSVNEDTRLSVAAPGVLANDTDANGDALTAILCSQPTQGTLTFNANGSFTYQPQTNFHGTDRFTYKANDGRLDSGTNTATITVNAVNDVPITRPDFFTTDEDRSLQGSPGVLGNDFDVEFEEQRGGQLTAFLTRQPASGMLSFNFDGSFLYKPNPNFNGTDFFEYRADDGDGGTSVVTRATITVNPVNDRPFARNLTVNTTVNTPIIITLVGSDVETPAASLIFDAPLSGCTNGACSFPFFAPDAVRYAPLPGAAGDDFFTYTVSDGQLTSLPATVTIHVLPELSIRDVQLNERGFALFPLPCVTDLTRVPIRIDLNARSPKTITVKLRLLDGTARINTSNFELSDYFFNGPDSDGTRTISIPPNTISFEDDPDDIIVAVVGNCECEPDETFTMELSSPVNAILRDDTATVTIINDDFCFGTAQLIPAEATVQPGERFAYSLIWSHPERWRLLNTVDLLISDDAGSILRVRFDEAANTFSVINPATGQPGRTARPGEPSRLESNTATVYMDQTEVVASGPTGPSVLLNYSLSFKPQAAGRTCRVEALATDDFGHTQTEPVGTLMVR
jgi:VCBS repeat-containing protein